MISRNAFGWFLFAFAVAESGFAEGQPFPFASDIRTSNSDRTFAADAGKGPVPVLKGYTLLDQPQTLHCPSAKGCTIIFSASMYFNESTASTIICGFVDGVSAPPGCEKPNSDLQNSPVEGSGIRGSRQLAIVTQGDHFVQTKIRGVESAGAVDRWEVDYVVYRR
jgi:hypothetical protein